MEEGKKPLNPAMDYEALRQAGLEHIRKYSGSVWTDHNPHDPGITMLEQLCFSLVDLGFRTAFPMPDLLEKGDGTSPMGISFIPAHEILQCNPVTAEDYRKLILENVEGIRNVTLSSAGRQLKHKGKECTVNGHYHVSLEIEETADADEVKKKVHALLMSHRNLCEDFDTEEGMTVLEPVEIAVEANVEVDRNADHRRIVSEIYKRLVNYVSPVLPLHSLDDLLEKGYTPDEIFQGLSPDENSLGFVDRAELRSFEQRRALHTSDVKNLLMGIPGVKGVTYLGFSPVQETATRFLESDGYSLSLLETDSTHTLSLSGFGKGKADFNRIVFIVNGLPFLVGKDMKTDMIDLFASRKARLAPGPVELPVPQGRARGLDRYFSIQNELPETYGIGRAGLSFHASDLRKAGAFQLKAYLAFFDQLLADYLEQLRHAGDILSWSDMDAGEGFDATYFRHVLSDSEISDISKVLSDSYDGGLHESERVAQKRRNQVLDHLLARFNEEFVDYSVYSFWKQSLSDFDSRQLIRDKKAFLANYAYTSACRSQAADYSHPWTYSGTERRIMSRLGIDNPPQRLSPGLLGKGEDESKGVAYHDGREIRLFRDNRSESFNTAFGVHLLEHVLLAPEEKVEEYFLVLARDGSRTEQVSDPYTFQVTAAVPGWLDICCNIYFRNMVEEMIREEIPAHVSVKICWLDCDVMYDLEQAYASYLQVLGADARTKSTALSHLVAVFARMKNIYPTSMLTAYDESLMGSDLTEATRMDFSVLGKSDYVRVVAIDIEGGNFEMLVQESKPLVAKVYPEDATEKTVVWRSSKTDIATVDPDGTVHAHGVGETVLSVSSIDGRVQSSVRLAVFEPITIQLGNKVKVVPGKDVIEMDYKDRIPVKVIVKPDGYKGKISSAVKGVIEYSDGVISAKGAGTGKLTVRNEEGASVTCDFNVSIAVKSVAIKSHEASMTLGGTIKLSVNVLPATATDQKIIWTSSDPSIQVKDGVLTGKAVKDGVKITATSASNPKASDSCLITVLPPSAISFEYDKPIVLEKGDTQTLKVNVYPESKRNDVIWTVERPEILDIQPDGTVKALSSGTSAVYVEVDGKKDACTVKVIVSVSKIQFVPDTDVRMKVGDKSGFLVNIEPKDADDRTVIWGSSDSCLQVEKSTNTNRCTVTAVRGGSSTVTATSADGKVKAARTVYVDEDVVHLTSITVQETLTVKVSKKGKSQIEVKFNPSNAADKTLSWSIAPEGIATVDAEGKVTPVKVGVATVTATSRDGHLVGTCKVTVTDRNGKTK